MLTHFQILALPTCNMMQFFIWCLQICFAVHAAQAVVLLECKFPCFISKSHQVSIPTRSIRRIIFNSLVKPSVNEKGEKEMDTISTSQALQIAGRAGRFSSMFKEGEVTTMHRDDLPVLKEILSRAVDPVEVKKTYETSVYMLFFYLAHGT